MAADYASTGFLSFFVESIRGSGKGREVISTSMENCFLPKDHPKSLLILLDINMPFWDGFKFLDELNSRTELPIHKIDVIILSSSIHRLDTEKAKEYKILDYIVKPLTPEKLQAALFQNK